MSESTREHFIKAAMQGILAAGKFELGQTAVSFPDPELVALLAREYADATMKKMWDSTVDIGSFVEGNNNNVLVGMPVGRSPFVQPTFGQMDFAQHVLGQTGFGRQNTNLRGINDDAPRMLNDDRSGL